MRAYTEDRFNTNEKTTEDIRSDHADKISQLFTRSAELDQMIRDNDSENKGHRKLKEIDQAKESIVDLFPGLNPTDIADDTGKNTLEVDSAKNARAGEARMFTLAQLHQLFSV